MSTTTTTTRNHVKPKILLNDVCGKLSDVRSVFILFSHGLNIINYSTVILTPIDFTQGKIPYHSFTHGTLSPVL